MVWGTEVAMGDASLFVSGAGHEKRVPLAPAGVVIGRHSDCDVVLDSRTVSRQHARLYRDPFGRWVVEDLDSRNGVWVGPQQVQAQAVRPGEEIRIGVFSLTVAQEEDTGEIPPEESTAATTLTEDVGRSEVLTTKAGREETLSDSRLKQLNRLVDELAGLSEPGELYPFVCRHLADAEGSVAMILRVPPAGAALPRSPTTLSFRRGGRDAPQTAPHAPGLHVSRRVLEAVRSSGASVMAGGAGGEQARMDLTVVDELKPRSVLCAPIGEAGEMMDVLYLDVPAVPAESGLLDYVQAAARQVTFARKALLLSEARAERRALDQQLNLAREIQAKLTPLASIATPGVEVATVYRPAMVVGGDYCDCWQRADGQIVIAVGDVSGKGLAAAMVVAIVHTATRTALAVGRDLPQAVRRLSRHLQRHMPDGMFVTLVVGLFDPGSGELEYVNAGHLLPVRVGPGGEARFLGHPTNLPVGPFDCPFVAERAELPLGSALVLVTDGITESPSPSGELFGEERLCEMLRDVPPDSGRVLADRIVQAAAEFRGPIGAPDDITVLAMRREPATA